MRDVVKVCSKILFYALAAAIFAWTCSLTIALVSRLLPGDAITPFFALAIFDIGALAWALVFLFQAAGLPQRAISLLAMVLDIAGVILMSIGELFLGGQQLTAIPEGLGTIVVWAVGLWTAANLVAIYAYHIADPDEMAEIRIRSMQDKIQDEALNQVEAQAHVEAQMLAAQIAKTNYADLLARLRLPSATADRVIDATAHDVPVSVQAVQYAADTVTDIGTPGNPTKAGKSQK
jgi:hypothetical protein